MIPPSWREDGFFPTPMHSRSLPPHAPPIPQGERLTILVVPQKDYLHHPFPGRINFMCEALAAMGHRVLILGFTVPAFSSHPPCATACTIIPAGGVPLPDLSLSYVVNAPIHYATMRKIVARERVDVVLAANILPAYLATFLGVPVVFDYLDHLPESASVYYTGAPAIAVHAVAETITHAALARSCGVITVTEELRDYLVADAHVPSHRITVIPNGVDTGLLSPIPFIETLRFLDPLVLGYVGSLERWTDLMTAIDALVLLPTARLRIFGPALFTDFAGDLRAHADAIGVADRVEFRGVIEYTASRQAINYFDIGINPQRDLVKNNVSLSGKIFMYLACGVPCLSADLPSVRSALGETLTYYTPGDPASFADGVRAICACPPPVTDLVTVAKQYEWDTLAARYSDVLMAVSRGA